MGPLVELLRSRRQDVVGAWAAALGRMGGSAFGGGASREADLDAATGALIDLLDRNQPRAAEELAAKVAARPSMVGLAVNDTVRAFYAVFEAVRPLLEHVYPLPQDRERLDQAVDRLRAAAALMGGILGQACLKAAADRQAAWDRLAAAAIAAPVGRLEAELRVLRTGLGAELNPSLAGVLATSLNMGNRLGDTLQNLMILRRLGEGLAQVARDPVVLGLALRPVAEELAARAEAENRKLAWEGSGGEIEVTGDADLLARVVATAGHRAIDEAPEGTTVTIAVEPEPATIRLAVGWHRPAARAHPKRDPGDDADLVFCRTVLGALGGTVDVQADGEAAGWLLRLAKSGSPSAPELPIPVKPGRFPAPVPAEDASPAAAADPEPPDAPGPAESIHLVAESVGGPDRPAEPSKAPRPPEPAAAKGLPVASEIEVGGLKITRSLAMDEDEGDDKTV